MLFKSLNVVQGHVQGIPHHLKGVMDGVKRGKKRCEGRLLVMS